MPRRGAAPPRAPCITQRSLSPLPLLLLLLLPAGRAAVTVNVQNFISNGSFESVVSGGQCTAVASGDIGCPSSLLAARSPPWSADAPFDVWYAPGTNCSDGLRCLDLNGGTGQAATISYPISLSPGLTYRLQVDYGTRYDRC